MGGSRARLGTAALAALALLAPACGQERQDAGAPSGEFTLDVPRATFPARQSLAEPARLRLEVVNRGERPVPGLSVTVRTAAGEPGQAPAAFAQRSGDPELADGGRPVWLLDAGPRGGDTAYVDTWTLGRLGAGERRTLEWRLTPVRAGRYTVSWRLAPAVVGDVQLAAGRTEGEFRVTIADDPVPARVSGDGSVVRGGS